MTNLTYNTDHYDQKKIDAIYEQLFKRYPALTPIKKSLSQAYELLAASYASGNKLLIAGNGGSCADAEHIVGELMKGFIKKRQLPEVLQQAIIDADDTPNKELAGMLQGALPAIALTGHPSLATAFLNDVAGEVIYAQQICGYGMPGDVFLGISTSGNAANIGYAITVAKAKGIKVIGLTGKDGGMLGQRSDVAIIVPESETYRIQELHLPIYHTLCLMLEERFF